MARRKSTRRGRGEGSVYQRSDGIWVGQVTVGYDENGNQRRKTVYGRTQEEALKKLLEVKTLLANGTFTDVKLTVSDYLEQWLDEKERHIKPTTHEAYLYAAKCLYSEVGKVKLDKLTPLRIQMALNTIADTRGAAAANKCRRVLFSAYKQAVRWQLVHRNPVEAVNAHKEQRRELKLWTPEEAARFLDAARPHRLYALFYLAMATGLRRGELMGLRWEDIKGNVLYVRQALIKAKGELQVSTPKTTKGARLVPLSPDVLEVLLLHRQRQDTERSPGWSQSGFVFVSETGTPLNPDNLTRLRKQLVDKARDDWKESAAKAGDVITLSKLEAGQLMPSMRLHDLRHLHASMAIKSGVDPKVLADRLGHARASFTLDIYTHLFDEQRVNAAVSLLDFLPKSEPGMVN